MISAFKVVTATEMARLEQGGDQQAYMSQAGAKVAEAAEDLLRKIGGKRVVLLIGKGNKGGDAYVAGNQLRKAGYCVRACPLFPRHECSELNQQFGREFVAESIGDFVNDDLIIDGLLGTGFRGTVEGALRVTIELANQSKKPILAIDIPSGLHANTGQIGGVAIVAHRTVTMGLAKSGLFLQKGWDLVGQVSIADFGLSSVAIEAATAQFLLPDLTKLVLPPMIRTHHKYQRGFVQGFGGSDLFKGSMKLSSKAALHAGAGIVKIFTLEDIGPCEDEVICQKFSVNAWRESVAKAQAVFLGPGLGRTAAAKEIMQTLAKEIQQPCVIDADGLFFLPDLQVWPKTLILTPHRGEMLHLLEEGELEEAELFKRCQLFVEEKQVILILKGAPTFIFSAGQIPYILHRADPGMATAGSGDVLTGIIAALLAQGTAALEAAILGVALHGLAGEAVAKEKTSYSYSATDLIEFLPTAFQFFQSSPE